MKHLLLLALVLFLKPESIVAQCPSGFNEVIVTIQPDQFPGETSWSLKDLSGTILAAGGAVGDTLCVPQGICLIFEIRDSYGDGMCCSFGNGFYAVAVNSVIQAAGGQFTFNEYSYINCPPGTHCGSAFTVYEDTLYTSYGSSIWHSFTPDSTGTYNVSTCFPSNSCDTRLWIYDHCTGLIWNNDMAGTLFYNDSTCGVQAFIPAGLQVGQTYYIRVGGDTSCSNDSIDWQITYAGPIVGCIDPAACNYNPLATVSNGNCIYPGDPNCNSGPDLIVDGNTLLSSLNMGIVNGNDACLIGEGCLSGYGARNVINFSTRIANIGDADYYIGAPATGNSQFVFDQCHGHWHYAGYAMYNIYDSLGVPLQAGFKNGFCVLDLQCFGGTAKYGCSNMGISAGCADIYGAGLACQWLDITNVPAGRYTLVVRVNWDQDPDKLGRQEQRFDNNVAAVCINITRDTANVPSFTVLPNCQPIIDCAGDTFGLAINDCMGNCNGSRISGDLNVDTLRNDIDVDQYLVDITALNAVMPCNDVNGDNALTVTDAALVSGCIRETNGSHVHQGATQNTHRHCEFPFNIVNTNDTVHLGIGMVNQTLNYIDLNMLNPDCRLLALDFTMSGVVIDSVVSLVGGFDPLIEWNAATGRIALLDTAEISLGKQLTAMPFVRVYFSTLTSTTVCVASINAAVNADYEETLKSIFNGCVTVTGINILYQSGLVKIIPNPSEGIFAISTDVLNGESANISILDAMGRVIYSSKEVLSAGKGISIDLSKHPKGVYLVRVLTGQLEVTERLVKL
jgi:hypothetical protein